MNTSILITGANGGIGKDTARQLALKAEIEKIYLACRNPDKAKAAKDELEERTGRSIFEIVIMDVSKPQSVKTAVASLNEPIDAVILNAGGMGGPTPASLTEDGVTQIFASNVLGHVVLVEELVAKGLLKNTVLYAGSEIVRGVKKMGISKPDLASSSVDEFSSIIDGSFFNGNMDAMEAYGLVKYIATLWMSRQARTYPDIQFITISPGGTRGTAAMDDMRGFQKIFYKYIGMPFLMPLMGLAHSLETGAKRFVDCINDPSLKSGLFYGSKENTITGPLVEQGPFLPDLANTEIQDNASEAIYRSI